MADADSGRPEPPGLWSPIVLVGLMATGKTTVGRALAARLGAVFRDSDADIEAGSGGVTVADLAAEEGVEAMHRRESSHLLAALATRPPVVVAAAASTIDDAACVAALSDPGVTVVWLRASVATMTSRFGSGAHRPSFGREPAPLLAEQLEGRGPRFTRVADLVVEVDHRPPAAIVDEIVAGLRARPGGGGN